VYRLHIIRCGTIIAFALSKVKKITKCLLVSVLLPSNNISSSRCVDAADLYNVNVIAHRYTNDRL